MRSCCIDSGITTAGYSAPCDSWRVVASTAPVVGLAVRIAHLAAVAVDDERSPSSASRAATMPMSPLQTARSRSFSIRTTTSPGPQAWPHCSTRTSPGGSSAACSRWSMRGAPPWCRGWLIGASTWMSLTSSSPNVVGGRLATGSATVSAIVVKLVGRDVPGPTPRLRRAARRAFRGGRVEARRRRAPPARAGDAAAGRPALRAASRANAGAPRAEAAGPRRHGRRGGGGAGPRLSSVP